MSWTQCSSTIEGHKLTLQNDIKKYQEKINDIRAYKDSIDEMIAGRFLMALSYDDDIVKYKDWCFENNIVCREVEVKPKRWRPGYSNRNYWVALEFTSKADIVTFKLNWNKSEQIN